MSYGAAELPLDEVGKLADAFAAAIPERALSMATLQGYLMTYKTRPYDAVDDIPGWVERKLREKKSGTRSDAPPSGADEAREAESESEPQPASVSASTTAASSESSTLSPANASVTASAGEGGVDADAPELAVTETVA